MIFIQPISDISFSSSYDKNIIRSEFPKWGISDRLLPTFKKIKPNDLILNYYKKQIINICLVDYTEINLKVSLKYFPETSHPSGEGVNYPNIIYFKRIIKCNIDFDTFKSKFDYSDKYYIRRIIPINQKGLSYYFKNSNNDIDEIIKKILNDSK